MFDTILQYNNALIDIRLVVSRKSNDAAVNNNYIHIYIYI